MFRQFFKKIADDDSKNLTIFKDRFYQIIFLFETFYEIFDDYFKIKNLIIKENQKLKDIEEKLEKLNSLKENDVF